MLAPILLAMLLLQGKPASDPAQEPVKQKLEVAPKPEVVPAPGLAPKMVLVDPGEQKADPDPDPDNEWPLEHDLNPERAKKEMKVGNFYLKKGNYTAAVARFREALKWHPRLSAAYFKLGEAYEKRGELRNALESYQKYLKLDPKGKKAKKVRKAIARLERELKQ